MKMTRVVVDTNVLISGLIWGGTPKKVIDKFRYDKSFILVLSPELATELSKKLIKKFHIKPQIVIQLVTQLAKYAEQVLPDYITTICRDPKDNMILDTALAGGADYVVTGDQDLLDLKKFKFILIVNPRTFIKIFS